MAARAVSKGACTSLVLQSGGGKGSGTSTVGGIAFRNPLNELQCVVSITPRINGVSLKPQKIFFGVSVYVFARRFQGLDETLLRAIAHTV